MSKCKKALWTILLSLAMSLALCFGIIFSTRDNVKATVSAETSFTATEETGITNMHIRDSFLLFFLSNNDYANAGSNTGLSATAITNYNTLDKVQVYTTDGQVLPLWKVVNGGDCYKRYGEPNSVSYKLNGTYNGTTIAGIYIPEGTEFPSYESGTKAYVTDKDYTLTSNDKSSATLVTSWTVNSHEDVEGTETNVTKIHLRATNKLLIFLDASDYANTGGTTEISGTSVLTNYNTLDKILVYTSDGEYTLRQTLAKKSHYNVWGETGSVSYDLSNGFNNTNVTKVVIPAGTEFPSYEYTNSGGAYAKYVTTDNIVFTNNGVLGQDSTDWSSWTFGAADATTQTTEETGITNMHIRDSFLLFFLDNNDYADSGNNVSIGTKAITDYNTLDKVQVYTTSGEVVPLWKIVSGGDCYKRYGEPNSVSYKLNGTYNGTTIAGIYIPEGTEFPSYESGTKAYVTDKDYTLTSNDKSSATFVTSWTVNSHEDVEGTETNVTKIHLRATNKLLIFLDASDYANTGGTTEISGTSVLTNYNTLDKILVYTADGEYTLRQTLAKKSHYNVWGETGSVSYDLSNGFNNTNVTKVVIPAGTEFPSYEYTNNGGAYAKYVTTDNIVFTNNGVLGQDSTDWSSWTFGAATEEKENSEPETVIQEVSVTMYGYNNSRLGIQLSQSDYDILNQYFEISAISDLNTMTNITYNGNALKSYFVEDNGTDDCYLQMWTHPNTFYFYMASPVSGDTIVIPAGTQFPSSAYISSNGENLSLFVTTEDVTFKFDGTNWGKVIVFEETEVSVGVYDYANGSLGLQLSESDYGTPNQAFKPVVIAALNTLSSITYNDVALKDCLGTANDGQMLLQMWGRANTIYFPMAAPVSGDTIVIPAGTQFPSSAYIANGTPSYYVTTEDVTFVNVDGNWEQVYTVTFMVDGEVYASYEYTVSNNDIAVPALPAKDGYIGDWESYTLNGGDKVVNAVYTEIPTFDNIDTKIGTAKGTIHIRSNRLLVFLTVNDYAGTATTKVTYLTKLRQYNTLDMIKLYTSEKKYFTLRQVLDTSSQEYYYQIWGETNSVSFPISTAYNGLSFVKVEIPAGTQFPSYEYTNGSGDLIAYTTTQTITLKNSSTNGDSATNWPEILSFEEIETEVTPLLGGRNLLYYDEEFNRTGLYIQVAENDYGTVKFTDAMTAIYSLNTLSYIEIDGIPLSEFNVSEAYINLHSELGCIGFLIPGKITAQQVSIKAGCQLPTYAQVSTGALNCFVVSKDTVFIADKGSWMTTSAITEVEIGELLPIMPNMGSSIFIGYEIGGQLYKAGTTATVAGKVRAVYVSYALLDGASIRMGSDIASSGIRFSAVMTERSYDTVKDYLYAIGLCVLPEDTIGSAGFNADHTAAPADFRLFSELAGKAPYIFDMYGNLTVRATISTVKLTNYNRSYVARTYVVVQYADGSQEYVYGDYNESNARTIYYVASEAYKDTSANYTAAQREILKEYTSTVADLVFNEETGIVSKNENVVDTPITGFIFESLAANVATVKITVDGEKPLLLLNGMPVRGNRIVEEELEGNLYTVSFIVDTDSALCYYASDDELAAFYNDYFALYSAAGDGAVTHAQTGAVVTYQADWGTNAIAWMNASKLNSIATDGSVSQYSADKNIEFYLNNIDVDKHGNVYSAYNDKSPYTANNGPDYSTVTPAYYMNGQGWAFPNSSTKGFESFHAEFISKTTITDSALLTEYNSWNTSGAYESTYLEDDGWTVNGATSSKINGVLRYTGGANSDGRIVFDAKDATKNAFTQKWTSGIYYAAENAPVIELRFLTDTPEAIKDFGIQWRVMSGTDKSATLLDTVYTVWQSDYASNPYDCAANGSGMFRSYFPMYTHANYKNQQIGDIRLVVQLADSYNGSPVTIELDYVRGMGDSRQSTNGAKYVIALNEYASYHNDISLLENNLERARKAMLFMLKPLQGENGLLNNSYLHRHDSYYGVPNGFWDIYPSGNLNAEANTYFYEALLAMAAIEEAAKTNGINAAASIEWHGLDGVEKTANWSYTAAELRNLAETVKANINSTFYNEETGRYAWSVRDKASSDGKAAGTLMDYGFTELNLHIVAAGIADEDKALSVMQWINGDRSVSGDKVTGAAIYQRVFAPVSTTVEHTANSDYIEMYTDKDFAYWCQDGGTIMHVSYYDIMARARVLGVENANARLSAIAGWFASVSDYYAANDGSGNYADFFKDYYAANGGNSLQGADGSGELGLQDEFKEASMLYATAPKTYLGLMANYGVLHVTPNLGNLEYFAMKGLSFGGITYSCYATENTVVLSNIAGEEGTLLKVRLALAYNEGQSVYVNGKLLAETAYSVQDGYAVILCDFTNVCVQVR